MTAELTPTDIAWIAFLSNIGYIAVAITAIVAGFCVWMWRKPVNKKVLNIHAFAMQEHYEYFAFFSGRESRFKWVIAYVRAGRLANETFRGALSMIVWLLCATAEPIFTALGRPRPFTVAFYYLRWKFAECAKYQQVWAMVIWIAYMSAGSLLSMYLASLPAPCVERHDCIATEARGIDIGRARE